MIRAFFFGFIVTALGLMFCGIVAAAAILLIQIAATSFLGPYGPMLVLGVMVCIAGGVICAAPGMGRK